VVGLVRVLVQATLPRALAGGAARLRLDDARRLVVLYDGDFPLKAFALLRAAPAGGVSATSVLALLSPGDAGELRGLISDTTSVERGPGRARVLDEW